MNFKSKSIFFLLIFFSFSFLLQSCSTVYYVGETTEPTNIYATQDESSGVVYVVPAGTKLLIKKKIKSNYYVIYDSYQGYSRGTTFNNYRKFNSSYDGNLYGYSTNKPSKSSSTSNSYRSSSSSGGSVNVKGYYRKNGTYVKPHTRSSPKRR